MTYGVKFIVRGELPQIVEFLRYASVLSIVSDFSETVHNITMWCPRGVARGCEKTWQEHNIQRLATFGFVALAYTSK